MMSPYGIAVDIQVTTLSLKNVDISQNGATRQVGHTNEGDSVQTTFLISGKDDNTHDMHSELISPGGSDDVTDMNSLDKKCLEDILYEADCSHKIEVVYEAVNGVNLSHLARTLAAFQPRRDLSKMLVLVKDVHQASILRELCSEQFQIVLEHQCTGLGLTRMYTTEDGVPLLDLHRTFNSDNTSFIHSNDDSPTLSDYVMTGFRRVVQTVFDVLISIRTDDDDEQPYGECD